MNRMLLLSLLLLLLNTAGNATVISVPFEGGPYHFLPDTIPPEISCPADLTVNLAPGSCDTILFYTIEATDDQGQVILIRLGGIASGGSFPAGETVNTYLATDLEGNTATCSFTITAIEQDSGILYCRDQTLVYLDSNCTKTMQAIDALEPDSYGCTTNYIIELDKTLPYGNGPWVPAILGQGDIDHTYYARVTSLLNGNKCWGNIVVKDSIPPTIAAQTINVPCILPLDQLTPSYLRDSFGILTAMPDITDACSGVISSFGFVDIQHNLPCDDTTTISGTIRRIWTANDGSGNVSTVEQVINRNRLLSDVQIPASGASTDCQNPDLTPASNGRPYIQFSNRQYELNPNSYCEFDVQFKDTIQPGACSGNYTVKRTWKIYDACLPFSGSNPKIGLQYLEVQDLAGPVIHCPNDMLITVDAIDCRAAVDLPDVLLSDNCSGLLSLQAFWMDSSFSKNLLGTISYNIDSSGMVDTLGVFGTVASFPIGPTTVLYTAEDSCGNTGDCTFMLTMADMVPPTAICDSLLVTGLLASGYSVIPAIVLDNGSTDDCAPLKFKAKLLEPNACSSDSLLTDSLHICCHNLGDTLPGILRVYDIAVPPGNVANDFGFGHFSDCSFNIKVSGSNPPSCVAPPNFTVECTNFDPTLAAYGSLLSQSCSVDSLFETADYSQFDSLCSKGTVTRTFTVSDGSGQTAQCSQKIVVEFKQDYYIRFPDDARVTMCDTSNIYGTPSFFGEDCENLVATYTEETFYVVPDACFKIERNWTIYNACTYDPNLPGISVPNPNPNAITNHDDNLPGPVVSPIQNPSDPWAATIVKINPTNPSPTNYSIFYSNTANAYTYKQIIKITDVEDPVIENCPNTLLTVQDSSNNDALLWNDPVWYYPAFNSSDLCESPSDISITTSDVCLGGLVNVEFQLFLDLNNDGVFETFVNSTDLPPANTILYNNLLGSPQARQFDFRPVPANQKWRFALEEEIVGNKKTATIKFNSAINPNIYFPLQLPHGKHKVKWFVSDGCGNDVVCERTIEIKDSRPPVVVCLQGLSVNILSNGAITLYATDFLQYTEDNCTPTSLLRLSLRRAGTGSGYPLGPNFDPVQTITFNCFDLGTQEIELWTLDYASNVSFCQSYVIVGDNGHFCPNLPSQIDGHITTELGEGVEDVSLYLYNGSQPPFFPPPTPFDLTDSTGYFLLPSGIPLIDSSTIKPIYDANPLNGITTFDLVLISKHILGIEALGSPYKMIAADANKSNSITTFDIVELRKLILGISQVLPNNDSWRFIRKSYVFPNPMNPFMEPIPTTILVSDLGLGLTDGDFIGVKVGDVNNSTIPHAGAPADDRNTGTLHFNIAAEGAETLEAGELFTLNFRSEAPMLGCQFTLNFKGLEILEIIPGETVSQDHFALFADKKAFTMAWETGGIPEFSLKCRALKPAKLSDMLTIGSGITKAEAYQEKHQQIQRFDLALRFPAMAAFELFQNQPNPFTDATDISFNLPESSMATLKILDTNGRLLYSQSAYYEPGVHTISLKDAAFEAKGLLYYQLETPKFSASKTMLKL